ncbi:hypothetical protein Sdagh_00270 [Streptomyces daghestanicus]|uniref:Uncharacterized protein n=1 Tax=Streptomyces daghestanicus TaxID=66885 RepID=A0ABQ3PTE7_9ACTN|nr:hypothetical protein Sdagh_00270 [Streptomyces daghestanicus]
MAAVAAEPADGDPVAGLPAGRVSADGVDPAGDLVSRGHRVGQAGHQPLDHQRIGVAHPARLDGDAHFEGAGVGDVAPAGAQGTGRLVHQDRADR